MQRSLPPRGEFPRIQNRDKPHDGGLARTGRFVSLRGQSSAQSSPLERSARSTATTNVRRDCVSMISHARSDGGACSLASAATPNKAD